MGNTCSDHRRKAQAIWLQNTSLLPQRVKSNSDQGFALLYLLERLLRRFAPRNARSAFLTVFHHTAIAKQGTRRSRAASMSERSELRSRREVRMENGVKNLMGSEAISQNLYSSLSYLERTSELILRKRSHSGLTFFSSLNLDM